MIKNELFAAWMAASVATLTDSSTVCCIFILWNQTLNLTAVVEIDDVSSRLRFG